METRIDIYRCKPEVEYAKEVQVHYTSNMTKAKKYIELIKKAENFMTAIRIKKNHIKVFIKN